MGSPRQQFYHQVRKTGGHKWNALVRMMAADALFKHLTLVEARDELKEQAYMLLSLSGLPAQDTLDADANIVCEALINDALITMADTSTELQENRDWFKTASVHDRVIKYATDKEWTHDQMKQHFVFCGQEWPESIELFKFAANQAAVHRFDARCPLTLLVTIYYTYLEETKDESIIDPKRKG